MAGLDVRITRLLNMSPAGLRAEWQAIIGEAAPDLPPSLLRRVLAHWVQEQAHCGLPAPVQRVINLLSRDPAAKPVEPEIRLKIGTRLLRRWNGKLHAVQVTEDGLLYDERSFGSLSHVAREITGAHWSGPRFFGLKKAVHPPGRTAANG